MAVVRFDCYEVDLAAGQLRKHGSRISLREQPWQVLAMLLERPGSVISREELQRRLWPENAVVDVENNLNTAVARLREALGDSADRPRFVETLPRRGYRFLAPVAHVPDTTHAPVTPVEPRAPKVGTADVLAYNSYIEARHYLDRGEWWGSWNKARDLLEAAIARDPAFALAYDALAELWWYAGFCALKPPRETLSIGIVYAMRAIEIDNSLAEAHALLAQYLKQLAYDWTAVQREMELALRLNPASPIVLTRYAITGLMPFGRIDEAIVQIERALEIDPLGLFHRMWLGIMLALNRQYERAIDQERLVLEIAPAQLFFQLALGVVYHEAGMFGHATRALQKAAELPGDSPLVYGPLGLALADAGDRGAARALGTRLRTMPRDVYVPPSAFAWIHLGLGEIDEFFERMNQAIEERDHFIMPIKSYRCLERIRHDARYLTLLRRMNLE